MSNRDELEPVNITHYAILTIFFGMSGEEAEWALKHLRRGGRPILNVFGVAFNIFIFTFYFGGKAVEYVFFFPPVVTLRIWITRVLLVPFALLFHLIKSRYGPVVGGILLTTYLTSPAFAVQVNAFAIQGKEALSAFYVFGHAHQWSVSIAMTFLTFSIWLSLSEL